MKYVLIDGNYQVYRSVFATKSYYTEGKPFTQGITVFLKMLKSLSRMGNPIVVFDHSRAQWRLDVYPDYKKRPKTPEQLKEKELLIDPTFKFLREIIPALGIPVLIIKFQEGDDVLFRLSQGLYKQQHQVLVVSDDGDYLQFIKEGAYVYQPMKDLFWTGKEMYAHEKGFNPHTTVLKKCLTGDTSDNIPNPPGVGPKAAEKILKELNEYTIKGLIQWLDFQPNSALKDKVRSHLQLVKRNWLLMNLDSIPLTTEEVMKWYEIACSFAKPDYKFVFNRFQNLELKELSPWLVYVADKMRGNG